MIVSVMITVLFLAFLSVRFYCTDRTLSKLLSEDKVTRTEAIDGLPPNVLQDYVERLIRLCSRRDSVRKRAADALVDIGDAAVGPLLDAVSGPYESPPAGMDGPDIRVKRTAVDVLSRIGDPRAAVPMALSVYVVRKEQWLNNDVRLEYETEVAEAIAAMGEEAGRRLLEESEIHGVLVGERALRRLAQNGSVKAILAHLASPSISRDLVANVLWRNRDPAVVNALSALLLDERGEPRWDIAADFAMMDDSAAQHSLAEWEERFGPEVDLLLAAYPSIVGKNARNSREYDQCIFLLWRHGTQEMAAAYSASGDYVLRHYATEWLEER